ncbi:MAG: TonB family protein [Burkholderiales bacterium]|nr:TonB family protein [Burkholderiales bacterium]
MGSMLETTGARRLLIAAGVSTALHAAIVLSINRQPGGGYPLAQAHNGAPLITRLAAAVTASVLPAGAEPAPAPATSAEPVPPPPPAVTGASADSAAPGTVYYFKSSELDRRPFPLARIEVPPPESATAESGAVMIRLRISERGRVEDARIMFGTGVTEFEAAALREFSRAQFQPGYRGNVAVRSEMLIEVKLHPPAPDASPAVAELAPAKN